MNKNPLILGCMRIAGLEIKTVQELIRTSLDLGINYFDHADIYGRGQEFLSEEIFSIALKDMKISREDLFLQSKCGISDGYYDLSKSHILSSVDAILKRLNCEYLDALLLHRPDALVEPGEVAEAFNELERSGKVKSFGVSNHNPAQIELLQKSVEQPLIYNQLQLSIMRSGMFDVGMNVNMKVPQSVDHDGYVVDYCRLNDITIQAWSPFQFGFFEGVFVGNDKFPELNACLNPLAEKYGVSSSAIAIAWILRHPANIQTIVGTTKPWRLQEMAKAKDISISREEWYEIYKAAGNRLP